MNTADTLSGPPGRGKPWGSRIPLILMVLGAIGVVAGGVRSPRELGFAYLLAFMFFLSLGLGALYLVMLHHLFDAGWSVPIRRFLEHLAFLLPVLALLFIPLAWLAPQVFPWMQAPAPTDQAGAMKKLYLNMPFFYLRAGLYFAVWTWLSYRLRYWSLRQDRAGDSECTYRMRKYAAAGVILVSFTLTFAAIDWMKALEERWYSTMYGVIYFAGSVWSTLALAYLLAVILQRKGPLREVVQQRQLHDLGQLLLVFTVFYAYVHFSQYFLMWNAHLPEETFWYAQRQTGGWWNIGLLIVFGHFLVPFLLLLRIDAKLFMPLMLPLCLWALAMQYVDLAFNIMPVLRPRGFQVGWMDFSCVAMMAGVLSLAFLRMLRSHPAYPLRDPRLREAIERHEIPLPAKAGSWTGGPA